jgi:hypothetical protein
MYADLARRVGAHPACSDDDIIPEKDPMKRWLLPFLAGLVIGICTTGLAWSFAALDQTRQELAIPDVQAEPTEAVLWTVDVDGESAP